MTKDKLIKELELGLKNHNDHERSYCPETCNETPNNEKPNDNKKYL